MYFANLAYRQLMDIQANFFQKIKSSIPSYSSLVDIVSEVLEISQDSAYRRIRGEKLLDFKEIEILSSKFNISIDEVVSKNSNTILFKGEQNTFDDGNFLKWMQDVLFQLEMVNSFSKKHIYFLLKDAPPWYHYYHPELASFKFFFWMKSILFNENLKDKRFSIQNSQFPGLFELTQKILKTYNKIDTTEIWNMEGFNTTLKQIELYHEMGITEKKEDTHRLYVCLLEVLDHLECMAESGKKFLPNSSVSENMAEYQFFVNEFVLGDNTFFVEIDNQKLTYLNYNVIYFIGTSDPSFNEGMYKNIQNLIQKSSQISKVGEKERKQFFNKLRSKVQRRIDLL
ncbi:hypothetical protein [Algoriphagus sp. PAP.12]|uniref:hypothetical protein n=1 Tax=Algoriphagus sp. PAP.12 TaxID=2996678 RepID=UPI00227BB017|nr:hypothetical protein [Algoriphagus sp. PAP.12]